MSVRFEGEPAEHCIKGCQHMELGVRTDTMYSNNDIYMRNNIVTCIHEDICKIWSKKLKKGETE